MKKTATRMALLFIVPLLCACAQYENQRGVDVNWQNDITGRLVKDKSTRQDVLALLGPPSQIISLDNESVLYYLFEHSQGEGLILILYNRMRINTRYDRAVFFFDENDVLIDYATHIYDPDAS
ncbi:MAG: hypothetical protein HRT77_05655 [Halioglobus sp.]|nr:hypothetical protein [Halioglobus sp.]